MTEQITYSEAMSEIKEIARKNGMTFRPTVHWENGKRVYEFVRRFTGDEYKNNKFTFWMAYENCMSGYVARMTF